MDKRIKILYPFLLYCLVFLDSFKLVRNETSPAIISHTHCLPNEYGIDCQYCVPKDTCVDGHYTCDFKNGSKICLPGWLGKSCQTKIEPDVTFVSCPDNHCRNGGSCVSGRCCCLEGFTGILCEIEIIECSNTSCLNGGICKDLIGQYECMCQDGFTGDQCETAILPETTTHKDSNCRPDTCYNNGTCFEDALFTYCLCPTWYTGDRCETYVRRKPANTNNTTCPTNYYGANCGEFCVETDSCKDGHYICDETTGDKMCKSGWIGHKCDTRYLPQSLDPFCPSGLGCKNDGQCFNETCCCRHNYSGQLCQIQSIGCLSSPCQNNGTCLESRDSFECHCGSEYGGSFCELILQPNTTAFSLNNASSTITSSIATSFSQSVPISTEEYLTTITSSSLSPSNYVSTSLFHSGFISTSSSDSSTTSYSADHTESFTVSQTDLSYSVQGLTTNTIQNSIRTDETTITPSYSMLRSTDSLGVSNRIHTTSTDVGSVPGTSKILAPSITANAGSSSTHVLASSYHAGSSIPHHHTPLASITILSTSTVRTDHSLQSIESIEATMQSSIVDTSVLGKNQSAIHPSPVVSSSTMPSLVTTTVSHESNIPSTKSSVNSETGLPSTSIYNVEESAVLSTHNNVITVVTISSVTASNTVHLTTPSKNISASVTSSTGMGTLSNTADMVNSAGVPTTTLMSSNTETATAPHSITIQPPLVHSELSSSESYVTISETTHSSYVPTAATDSSHISISESKQTPSFSMLNSVVVSSIYHHESLDSSFITTLSTTFSSTTHLQASGDVHGSSLRSTVITPQLNTASVIQSNSGQSLLSSSTSTSSSVNVGNNSSHTTTILSTSNPFSSSDSILGIAFTTIDVVPTSSISSTSLHLDSSPSHSIVTSNNYKSTLLTEIPMTNLKFPIDSSVPSVLPSALTPALPTSLSLLPSSSSSGKGSEYASVESYTFKSNDYTDSTHTLSTSLRPSTSSHSTFPSLTAIHQLSESVLVQSSVNSNSTSETSSLSRVPVVSTDQLMEYTFSSSIPVLETLVISATTIVTQTSSYKLKLTSSEESELHSSSLQTNIVDTSMTYIPTPVVKSDKVTTTIHEASTKGPAPTQVAGAASVISASSVITSSTVIGSSKSSTSPYPNRLTTTTITSTSPVKTGTTSIKQLLTSPSPSTKRLTTTTTTSTSPVKTATTSTKQLTNSTSPSTKLSTTTAITSTSYVKTGTTSTKQITTSTPSKENPQSTLSPTPPIKQSTESGPLSSAYLQITPSGKNQNGSDALEWWIILIVVLAIVLFGVLLVVLLIIIIRKRRSDFRSLEQNPEAITAFDKEHFSIQPDIANPTYEADDSDDDSVRTDMYIVNK